MFWYLWEVLLPSFANKGRRTLLLLIPERIHISLPNKRQYKCPKYHLSNHRCQQRTGSCKETIVLRILNSIKFWNNKITSLPKKTGNRKVFPQSKRERGNKRDGRKVHEQLDLSYTFVKGIFTPKLVNKHSRFPSSILEIVFWKDSTWEIIGFPEYPLLNNTGNEGETYITLQQH